MGMAGATLLASGMTLWWIRDAGGRPQTSGGSSLLDILEEVRKSRPLSSPRRAAPPPPAHPVWDSPLKRACGPVNPTLRERLTRQLANLPNQTLRVNIHPTNYGERLTRDAYGNPLDPTPRVVVLHETVYGLRSALNTFLTPHPRDEDQVSYHVLIGERGEVVQTVDPSKRAFGAGNSTFARQWAVTNPAVGGSINNFALHLSLETPLDGEDQEPRHSGYTAAQYDAMAVVLADWMGRYPVSTQAITTHRHVDLAGARADPRSFQWQELQTRLEALGVMC
jgi:N-acetylmuramoyl-L-alanine amidase